MGGERRGSRRGHSKSRRHPNGFPTQTPPRAQLTTTSGNTAHNLRGLYETPTAIAGSDIDLPTQEGKPPTCSKGCARKRRRDPDRRGIEARPRTTGIPTVTTTVAAYRSTKPWKAAKRIGYPVVLKLHSRTITHKTDVGGVILNLANELSVRAAFQQIRESVTAKVGAEHFEGVSVQPMIRLSDAYELIMGSSIDPQFGPVLLFGTGGQLVEVFKDRALALPPLNTTLARRMMEQTRIFHALKGVRGRKPVDMSRRLERHPRQVVTPHH